MQGGPTRPIERNGGTGGRAKVGTTKHTKEVTRRRRRQGGVAFAFRIACASGINRTRRPSRPHLKAFRGLLNPPRTRFGTPIVSIDPQNGRRHPKTCSYDRMSYPLSMRFRWIRRGYSFTLCTHAECQHRRGRPTPCLQTHDPIHPRPTRSGRAVIQEPGWTGGRPHHPSRWTERGASTLAPASRCSPCSSSCRCSRRRPS